MTSNGPTNDDFKFVIRNSTFVISNIKDVNDSLTNAF